MKIESVLAIANQENLNGRVYSTELLNDTLRQFEDKKPMYGELGMPSEPVVSLKNASHKIVSVRMINLKMNLLKKIIIILSGFGAMK